MGIDISNYNTGLNYQSLRADGVEFAYILMTDGTTFKDGQAPIHVQGCEKAGIKWGGYHFLRPNSVDLTGAAEQTAWYLQMLHSCGTPNLPNALDVETQDTLGWHHLATVSTEWMMNTESATGGRHCILYTNVSFAKAIPGWPLGRQAWLADPSNVAPHLPRLVTQTGQRAFNGSPGVLDVDEFVGSEAEWEAFLGGTPAPAPPPIPTGEQMAVSPAVSFKPGQTDVFQVSGGVLWHKFLTSGGWNNEGVAGPGGGVAGATVTLANEPPQVALVNGQCVVTCEDTAGKVWYFAQSADAVNWGVNELP
jgi:GH25 family lysozyme M1 (1,4-beta-N-acetylmuramidase)